MHRAAGDQGKSASGENSSPLLDEDPSCPQGFRGGNESAGPLTQPPGLAPRDRRYGSILGMGFSGGNVFFDGPQETAQTARN
jgi:hypothetical protein